MPTYDLLIQGGTVLDPASYLHADRDIAIANGRIAAVGSSIPPEQAAHTIDARRKLVVPGLIDLHSHLFAGVGDGVAPDRYCLPRGTTTALDGGSTGSKSFEGLDHYVIQSSQARVLAWLNISSIGLIDTRVGELMNLNYVDVESAVQAAQAYRQSIVGFKIRLSSYVAGATFHPALKLVREAADASGLPIMAHIGETFEPLPEALPYFRAGDVITHTYTGRRHGILDYDGRIWPAVREARQEGIWFDAAHGRMHWGFDVIRRALEQGFLVDSLSTDITTGTAPDPTYHLPHLMSKLMALGIGLDEAVALSTSNPARFLNREQEIGTLQPGAAGDVAILERLEGVFTLHDNEGQTLPARQRLRPWLTVRAGQIFAAAPDA